MQITAICHMVTWLCHIYPETKDFMEKSLVIWLELEIHWDLHGQSHPQASNIFAKHNSHTTTISVPHGMSFEYSNIN